MDHRDATQAYTLAFIEWRIATQVVETAIRAELESDSRENQERVEKSKERLLQADRALQVAGAYYRQTSRLAPRMAG